ncbi:MAG TPA: glycosyl hydrolase, partial [Verrucomicrobiota bacterium]|nr:glycosyl hydrolase [Verrucomicrobiota bacterium]
QEDANKNLIWSETHPPASTNGPLVLPPPAGIKDNYYRDVAVVAFPNRTPAGNVRAEITDWRSKAMLDSLRFEGRNAWFLANSAPATARLILDKPGIPGEEAAHTNEVLDLSDTLSSDGTLDWTPTNGSWIVLRFGATIGDHAHVSTSSDGWKGYALDPLDAGAFRRYWDSVVQILIADAGTHAGTTLKYLHTDSWEVDAFNWTPTQIAEFKKRRGYDPLPWLPTLAGYIVDDRKLSNRFLHDYRRTLADLAMDNHFRLFRELASAHKLQIHPESGGPHFTPIDAQQCLANNDVPMAEFWAESRSHRVDDVTRFFVKQPASAAHTAGRRFVAAEGFTTVGPHWQETLWDNLKPSFDMALCEGLNLLVWHAFVCSPEEEGLPGIQYFAGTHFNPATTWWEKSAPFLAYINRSQWMMQQGLFVADVLQYYGDHAPNYTQLKSSDPAKVLPGYDYDVIAAEQLLTRLQVKRGRLTLPD